MAQTRTPSQRPSPASAPPTSGPSAAAREVLDAALELFLEHGYDGTSMQAVADAAGVTKPVVYACFAGKDELFRALLAREEERILAEIQGAFADVDLTDPETTLIEGFTGFLRAVGDSPEVYRLIFLGEGGGNAAVARRIQRGREAQVDALCAAREGLARRDGKAPTADDSSGPRACSATRSPGSPSPVRDCCSPARTAGRPRRSAASSAGWRPRLRPT